MLLENKQKRLLKKVKESIDSGNNTIFRDIGLLIHKEHMKPTDDYPNRLVSIFEMLVIIQSELIPFALNRFIHKIFGPKNAAYKTVQKPELSWPFFFVKALDCEAALADLDELWPRFLKRANGNTRKAARIYKWQVLIFVVLHKIFSVSTRLKNVLSLLGLSKIFAFVRGFIG